MPYIVDQTAGKLGRGEDLKSVISLACLEKSLLHFPPCRHKLPREALCSAFSRRWWPYKTAAGTKLFWVS
ncbi:hypothetical protein GBA52_025189 [Prunus armeniaca]|nr:hypothetical protein GBA52_025189 [Prunus armeniaca]